MNFQRFFSRAVVLLGFVTGTVASLVAADAAPAKPSTYVRTIYLIRHGNYDQTQAGDPSVTNELTPLGIAQARLVAARLRGMPVTFTSLNSSTLTRARQTARVIGHEFPSLTLQQTPLLCECQPRSVSERTNAQVSPEDLDASEKQLNEAFAKFFVPATERDEHDLLVCHGNVIRYLVIKAVGADTKTWTSLSVAHCSITIIQVRADGSCKILAVGDTGHIPPNLLSGHTAEVPALVEPTS